MVERHDLNIVISETGEIEITVEGVNGPKCLKLTDFLEEDLGDVISREKTSEYYKDDIATDVNIETHS